MMACAPLPIYTAADARREYPVLIERVRRMAERHNSLPVLRGFFHREHVILFVERAAIAEAAGFSPAMVAAVSDARA